MTRRAKTSKRTWRSRLKESWNEFQARPSGKRFQSYYQREQSGTLRHRVVQIGLGVLLLVVGGILLVIPGPGIPVLVAGAVLVARHVRPAARFLDWLDVRVRRVFRGMKREWKESSVALRTLMVAGVLAVAGTLAYGVIDRIL